MRFLPVIALAFAAAPLFSLPAAAQADASQCIVAGRLADGAWAPRFGAVQLLSADGRSLLTADRQALGQVRQARLAQPALLSRCDGNNPLARADDEPAQAKTRAPAVSAGC